MHVTAHARWPVVKKSLQINAPCPRMTYSPNLRNFPSAGIHSGLKRLDISKDKMPQIICTNNLSLRIPYHPETANKFLHTTFSSEHVRTMHWFCLPSQVSLEAHTLGLIIVIQEWLISFFIISMIEALMKTISLILTLALAERGGGRCDTPLSFFAMRA